MATQDLGRVVGKSAYEYAVDGGYTGTEEEFTELMADTATKSYVDTLFNQVAPVIVKVQLVFSVKWNMCKRARKVVQVVR